VKSLKAAALLLILAAAASAADTIAYVVPDGTPGNQNFSGSLGMDFDVVKPIVVTQLGVFHDTTVSSDLQAPLEVKLYQRDPTGVCHTILATLEFKAGDEGKLTDSSFFKPLPTPITLPAGFHGTIEASGYGNLEMNGNMGLGGGGWYTDDGGGLISFVGGGRFGDEVHPKYWPANIDGGPENRYAAGTFMFHAQ
jgi:hypothetical protein